MGSRGGASHRATKTLSATETFMKAAYGKKHSDKIMELLNSAPKDIRTMFDDFAPLFKAYKLLRGEKTAYYWSQDSAVHLNIDKASKETIPYEVVFHEYGHMIDNMITREAGIGNRNTFMSEVFQSMASTGDAFHYDTQGGGLLGRTIKEEVQGHIKRLQNEGHKGTTEIAEALKIEVFKKYNYDATAFSDISDMFEGGGLGVGHPFYWGHGTSYWIGRDNGKEAFAEMTSAIISNKNSLTAIKDYFPKSYAVYEQIINAYIKTRK